MKCLWVPGTVSIYAGHMRRLLLGPPTKAPATTDVCSERREIRAWSLEAEGLLLPSLRYLRMRILILSGSQASQIFLCLTKWSVITKGVAQLRTLVVSFREPVCCIHTGDGYITLEKLFLIHGRNRGFIHKDKIHTIPSDNELRTMLLKTMSAHRTGLKTFMLRVTSKNFRQVINASLETCLTPPSQSDVGPNYARKEPPQSGFVAAFVIGGVVLPLAMIISRIFTKEIS
ncbi:hypothetical protein DFS33DRAFT_889653 [Desarmillaria ectypa]|nr:hypothetical protein DFS33DRAFT_889653 [Desarmillaria ectypa]